MEKKDAVKYIRYCMCEGRLVGNTKPIIDEKWQAGDMAIKALEQQDKIEQIIDDYVGEAWEVLEMIKEVVRA